MPELATVTEWITILFIVGLAAASFTIVFRALAEYLYGGG